MVLNWFLPFRKRPREGKLPLGRRVLGKLGPTWSASPARRVIQGLCLALFAVLLLWVCFSPGPGNYAEQLRSREFIRAELFLALDPLVSFSTAVASRTWVWSLTWAAAILAVCLVIPGGFCGYLCPLGTLIDLFDWALGRRVRRLHVTSRGWWVYLRYYLLAGVLLAAVFGVLVSGFVSSIAVLTRGATSLLGPLQVGIAKGYQAVPPLGVGHFLSIGLLLGVLVLGFLGPRFWCRCVCPTGAIFSAAKHLRLSKRKVGSSCIECGRCAEVCPFDAIKADFATRQTDCTFCQTCGGACPVGAISFTGRWDAADVKPEDDPPATQGRLSRRGFLAGAAGGLAVVLGMRELFGAGLDSGRSALPVRPPGSVPEEKFLQMCVRCGQCIKACPSGVLQPSGFQQGLEGLWTPRADCDFAGCEPKCNLCGQVCPTGAIRALPLAEKRAARMGRAIVNEKTCLPYAGRQECLLCQVACAEAGHHAIEVIRVNVEVDDEGMPIEDSGFLAPVVTHRCVGCGLCQARCYRDNVQDEKLLERSAILIQAGAGNEDRMLHGSYRALRQAERRKKGARRRRRRQQQGGSDGYLPDFLR